MKWWVVDNMLDLNLGFMYSCLMQLPFWTLLGTSMMKCLILKPLATGNANHCFVSTSMMLNLFDMMPMSQVMNKKYNPEPFSILTRAEK